MLIKESELKNSLSGLKILDEAIYISEEESKVHPVTIPVREMSRLGEGVAMVRFEDVDLLSEEYGISYAEAMSIIAEANDVELDKLVVAVSEDTIVEDPDIVYGLNNIVVSEMSSNDPIGILVESIVEDAYEKDDVELMESNLISLTELKDYDADSGLHGYIQAFGKHTRRLGLMKAGAGAAMVWYGGHKYRQATDKSDIVPLSQDEQNKADRFRNIGVAGLSLGTKGLKSAAMGQAAVSLDSLYLKYKNRPRNVISKAIVKLRKLYSKIMDKMNSAGDKGIKNKLKKFAGKILTTIDKLMFKMQKAANDLSK